MKKLILLLTAFAMVSLQCIKKEDVTIGSKKLPDATQEGKNTFGGMVNGSVWLPYVFVTIGTGNTLLNHRLDAFYYRDSIIQIAACYDPEAGKGGLLQRIILNIKPDFTVGSFVATLGKDNNSACFKDYKDYGKADSTAGADYQTVHNYKTDVNHTGKVSITRFDTVAKILSGTFEFIGKDSITNKTTEIKSGRFDVVYKNVK